MRVSQLLRMRVIVTVGLLLGALVVVPEAPSSAAPGPCTIRWVAGNGAWETATNWRDVATTSNRLPVAADVVCIDDTDPLTSLVVTASGAKTVAGMDNAEELRLAGTLTIGQGGEVLNRGVVQLSGGVSVVATSGGVAERFVNDGTLRVAAGPSYGYSIGAGVTMEPAGTVDVQAGTLTVADVGVWPGSAATVAAGATLRLQLDAASDPYGDWTANGDGTVVLEGLVQPKSTTLVLGFASGRLQVSGTLDGSFQQIQNAGVLPLATQTVVGDVAQGVGVVNLPGGEVRQIGTVSLAEGAATLNQGLWVMSGGVSVVATSGGVAERFVNDGTLRVAAGPSYGYSIGAGVTMEPAGTVDVQAGTLTVADVGVWPGSAATVAAGATLRLQLDAASDPYGDWTANGDGTVVLEGLVQPKSTTLVLGFASGRLQVSGTLDGSFQQIQNAGVLPLATQTVVGDVAQGVGVVNLPGGEVRQIGTVSLAEGAATLNQGLWVMSGGVSVVATSGGVAERFVNDGTLRVAAGPSYGYSIGAGVTMEPAGTVDVQAGTLTVADVGVWPGSAATVAAGATLRLQLDAASDPYGDWTANGDGTVVLEGLVQPKSTTLVLGFASGRLQVSGTLDGSFQQIQNAGVLPLATQTVVGDVAQGVGVVNLPGGEVRQIGTVSLAEGAATLNQGLWVMSGGVSVVATSGGVAERFVNDGTLRVAAGPSYGYSIGAGVTMEPAGTVDVQAGTLTVADAIPQVSGTTLNGGTWRVAGTLNLTAAPTLTTIASGASVELVGSGSFPKLSGLSGVSGSLRLSGGKDLTTGPLLNLGTAAVGPTSRLTVNGTFTNSGTFITGIAGLPAGGQFGDLVATGSLALGGTATVERDPAYSPSPGDVFTIARGSNITSQFGAVDAPGFVPTYTSTAFVLNGTGSVPVARAGPDVTVSEATPPTAIVLDGSGSTDTDGTITSYAWTATAGVALTGAATAQAGYAAADDAAFTATLEVCDDDALCDTDTALVTVTNAAPTIAIDPIGAVERGVALVIGATYADAGGLDTHTATVDWGPGSPVAVIAADGVIGATHIYSANGPQTITVCVTDDDGARTCATADITVTGPEAPVATDDTVVAAEDVAIDIDVLANDTDLDTPNDQLTVSSASLGGLGTTQVVGRLVRYTSNANTCGPDTFTYTVSDGTLTDQGTVTLDVACANDAPVASAGGNRTLQEGTQLRLNGSVSDAEGGPVSAVWTPAIGLDDATLLQPLALAADDAATTYTLTVCDAGSLCDDDTAAVTITNVTPFVPTQTTSTAPGTPVSPSVTFTDAGTFDTHTATVVWPGDPTPLALGTVSSPFTLPSRTFSEPGTYVGQVCVTDDDGAVGCGNQTVIVRSESLPDAVDDAFDITTDTEDNVLAVRANDTDADGDQLTIVASSAPSSGGTVTCSATSCSYTPDAGFVGTETFTYTVADGVNGEDTATVTLTVRPINRPPEATLQLTPTTGVAPLDVVATIGADDPDDGALEAVLDWGDGSVPANVALPITTSPAHTYTVSGTYLARLEVSDGPSSDIVTALVRVGTSEPLDAVAGDDQVVALGERVRLDGSASRPAIGIGGYDWTVRDGDGNPVASSSGPVFDWTPSSAGVYVARLTTVTGFEQDVDAATITVVDPASEPGLLVTVRDGGALLHGADVLAVDADGVRFAGVTDATGTTRLLGLPDGDVSVYAFAPGYLPAVGTAGVADGSGSLTIQLDAGAVAQTVLESRRLTLDEIVALGIDPNNPDNQNVFEFEIHLAFTPDDPEPVIFTGYTTGGGAIVGGEYSGGGGGGGFGVGTGVSSGGYTVYPTVRSVGGQPIIIWLIIPGEARWLKEFFEIRMVVSNLAPQPFTFNAGTASLDALPDGLSLAPTAEPQQAVQTLADIPAGGSASATWIVRGDTAGDYELSATYAASLEPIGSPVSMVARTAPGALKVWAGDALFMRVLAEERLLDGHPYRVVIELENISDIPVYNLAVELKEEGKLNYIYQPREELTRSIAELAPGETLTADYVLVPTVGIFTPLELIEEISFVKKTGGNTDIASEIVSVPPRFPDADRPDIAVNRDGGDVRITWDPVPGATDFQLFTTAAPELPFGVEPIATAPAGATSITLPLTADLVGKHIAVSPTLNGRPDMVHRRVALLGNSFVTVADEPSVVDRVAVVGDGLMAGATPSGTGCSRSANAFAELLAADLGVGGTDAANVACDGAAAGNVAFAPPGASLDDAYVTGPQLPLSTTTQADDVATFAGGGQPDLVLAGFGAEDLGLESILGQCGSGCDTRWRFTAQQLLRDRVYPRVYENLRALRATHPDAVVVAFTYPTPVAAGSACATFGTGVGITAAESTFLANELYPWLQTTMRRAAINAGVNLVDVTPALTGHQACSAEPWINGLVLDGDGSLGAGSFLPNGPGQDAIAAYLQGVVVDDGHRLLLENPDVEVLRVLAPQEEAPFVVPVTAVQTGACAFGTCLVRITVGGLRNGDRVDLLVGGVAPVPAEASAGSNGSVDVTVQVPAPATPTAVLVEVSSIDRNARGSTVVTVGVPVNRAPIAVDDVVTMDEDGIAVIDVTLNDSDPDGDPLTVQPVLVAGPANGTGEVGDDAVLGRRVVRYRPAAGFCGSDTFTYEIADSGDLRSPAAVGITVRCINDAPSLVAAAPTVVTEGATAVLAVEATDVDSTALTYSWSPAAGLDDPTLASPTFTSTDDGSLTFSVTVCDDGVPRACSTLVDAAVVDVTNAVPAVTAAADATGQAGTPLTLDPIATYTDAGAADTHTATIEWGDGGVDGPVALTGGTVSGTHTYATAGTFQAAVCVTDDDGDRTCDSLAVAVAPAGPRVSVGDARVDEPDIGTVNVSVPVALSVAPTRNVAIRVETVDGSALAGADYTAKTATVTFTPTGALTRTVTFAVRGDLLAEPDETFQVRVIEPASVGIADGSGTVTIVNDDDCTVVGTTAGDSLVGTAGDDVICALAGDDVIDGAGGDDVIRGDVGVDTITYQTAPAGVIVDLAGGVATDRGAQRLSGIEQVYGSELDDTLTGGTGNDLLVGLGGGDTLTGGLGNDELDGGDAADGLDGGAGNDFLFGGDGADAMAGGAGADRIDGESGDDTADGGDGNDVLRGGAGGDVLTGGTGNDRIDGQGDDDTADGGDGNDVVAGGDGDDELDGGLGIDDLSGGAGNDVVRGGDGNDTVQGDDGDDALSGGLGDDVLTGDEGDDTLAGDGGRDRLNGGRGVNALDGGDGQDSCRLGSTSVNCERP